MRQVLQPPLRLVARLWPVATLACLALITWGSFQSETSAVGAPNPYDKVLHLVAYACVAGPVGLAWPRKAWIWLGVLVLWGAGIEVLQPLVGREGSWDDLLANLGGLALGALAGRGLGRLVLR